jgi:hypothetical protein
VGVAHPRPRRIACNGWSTQPSPLQTFAFEDAIAAFRKTDTGDRIGKVLIRAIPEAAPPEGEAVD